MPIAPIDTQNAQDGSQGAPDVDTNIDDADVFQQDDTPPADDTNDTNDTNDVEDVMGVDYVFDNVPDDPAVQDFAAHVLDGMAPVMRELGLTQKQADALFDVWADVSMRSQDDVNASLVQWNQQQLQDAQADPEIGGNHWEASVQGANAVIRQFGTPQLVRALNDMGLANNPELIRVFARVHNEMREDSFVSGRHVDTRPATTMEQRLYPGMPTSKRT